MFIRSIFESAALLLVLYFLWHPDKLQPLVEFENRIFEKIFTTEEAGQK